MSAELPGATGGQRLCAHSHRHLQGGSHDHQSGHQPKLCRWVIIFISFLYIVGKVSEHRAYIYGLASCDYEIYMEMAWLNNCSLFLHEKQSSSPSRDNGGYFIWLNFNICTTQLILYLSLVEWAHNAMMLFNNYSLKSLKALCFCCNFTLLQQNQKR